ncbi:MAG: tetratricopeptide repeat protein, partial [Sediminispirochaetaceae bacterium]
DGTVWLPVETTLLEKGFLSAWAEGARQWRTNDAEKQAGFFPTAEAWKTYQPVAFSVSPIELGLPARDQVVGAVSQQLKNFIDQEIYPQERTLRARLESRPNDPRLLNQLGILYARYGRYSDARREFEQVLTLRSYTPTIINLANIHYIEGNLGRARRRYEDALEQDEDNTAALLGLARVEHELENFGSARNTYEKLASVSPEIAEENQYLLSHTSAGDEIGRASSAGNRQSGVVWEE